MHRLKAVGEQLRLLASRGGVRGRPLRLHHGQRFPVVAPENVVSEPLALCVRHPRNPVFPVAGTVERPPGSAQLRVDQPAPRFGLRVVVRIRDGFARGADLRQPRTQLAHLRVQRVALPPLFEGKPALPGKLFLKRFKFSARNRVPAPCLWHSIIPPRGVGQYGAGSVGSRQPVADVEQLLHREHGVRRANRTGVVHGAISHALDHPRLLKDRLRKQILKGGLVEQRAEAVVVRHPKRRVAPEKPVHSSLQREARMETCRARIAGNIPLRPNSGLGDIPKILRKEGEVTHGEGSLVR